MSSLRELLNKPGALGVFMILEIICFLLIIYANDRQGKIFHSFLDSAFGTVQETSLSFTDRLAYKKRFDSLQVRYVELLNQQEDVLFNTTPAIDSIHVDSIEEKHYAYRPAKVIANSFALKNNYLSLNKGSKHGIAPGMGVRSSDGLVGIVVAVNNYYARVVSLLHSRTMITAEIKGKKIIGSLTWGSNKPDIMYLKGVPKHYDIDNGDLVETSLSSRVFPAGIPIGEIVSHDAPAGSSTYQIEVKLNNDLKRVKDVYIIEHLHKDLINQLEEAYPDE